MTQICGGALAALFLLLPSAVAAQRADPGPLADARRGIDRGNAQYIAGFARADADGVRFNENGEVLRGRQAIAKDVRGLLDQAGPVKVALQNVQVWLVDDLAYGTGTWSYSYTPKGKTERTIGGRYVTTWKRQADGGWKIQSNLGVPGS